MELRLIKLKKLLVEQKLDAALISSVPNIIYLTNFSSFSPIEREAFLLITKKHNYILTDGRYSHGVNEQVKNFSLLEITPKNRLQDILADVIKNENLNKLGFEAENLTVNE